MGGYQRDLYANLRKTREEEEKERKDWGRPAGKWHLFYLMSVSAVAGMYYY